MSGQIQRINTCGNCAFVHSEGLDLFCRFAPPSGHPIAVVKQNEAGEVVGANVVTCVSVWPTVKPDQWCGHHKKQLIEHAHDLPARGPQMQIFGGGR